MCRAIISLGQKSAFHTSPALSLKRERGLLKKIFEDIAQRGELQGLGIDLLHFLKCTALPGLFGEQFFNALDQDHDSVLSKDEFVTGVLHLYRGTYTEVAETVFKVLDFGQRGYVSMEEMKLLWYYLPTECLRCGAKITRNSNFDEKLRGIFGSNAVLSCEEVLKAMERNSDFFDDILQALLGSLPPVIDKSLAWGNRCDSGLCAVPSETTLTPLKYEGRRYFFDLRHQALYCYASIDRTHLHSIILLKGVFVEPKNDCEFALHSLSFVYEFEAETEQDRDKWVDRILDSTNFRWFDDYYETGKTLGIGGNGRVLKVKHRFTGISAAVKIIDKDSDPKSDLRLRRELDVLRLSKHENLLEMYDVFETKDRVYIVTELIHGGSLFSWLEKHEFAIEEKAARKIVSDVANGLSFLHSRGIVHRDVKLENVLLVSTGATLHAKLIDFGLSTFLAPGRMSTEPVGTLKYASPEVVSRMEYTEKVDCWSLGVVLYILLRGTTPFYGKSEYEIAIKILQKRIRYDGEKWAGVSIEAKSVLERLLRRRAQDRMTLKELLSTDWVSDGNGHSD